MSTPLNKYNCLAVRIPPKPKEEHVLKSPVVPFTRRNRLPFDERESEKKDLQEVGEEAKLLLDDDRVQSELVPSYSSPIPTVQAAGHSKLGTFIDNNPLPFLVIFMAALKLVVVAGGTVLTIDLDVALLIIFSAFCLGLHCPRPLVGGIDRPPLKPSTSSSTVQQSDMRRDTSGSMLLRRSMINSPRDDLNGFQVAIDNNADEDKHHILKSPMDRFPEGASIGSHVNCWSLPNAECFMVRGEKYLKDKKKIPSGPYLFPCRGVDLFLTDSCPENVGRLSTLLGGSIRDIPTFIVNFRLPWGVLIFYYEIPSRFIPFLRARYEDSFDQSTLPALKDFSNSDRCCARFLQGDDDHKTETLKLIPTVVDGPWIVKSVVGGKPAIIGNKLPVKYVYEPESEGKALYLEADLDIAASSAARGVLSVTRSYTQILTIDLGFVIQGNRADELPEQMLVGTRLHGIDPLTAPPLLPMKDMFMGDVSSDPDD